MKTFSLICDQGHGFELMVKSLESLEDQQARGLVTCPYCNSGKVERTLATPAVKGGKGRGKSGVPIPVSTPTNMPNQAEMEKAYRFFSQMRAKVEQTHENVGNQFADEARAMHYGEKKERGIYGEASPAQVKDLIDEGVEVAPLPNLPKLNG